jgi:DNA-binding NarL/FixJ family response regulator
VRVVLADDHQILRDGMRWMLDSDPDIDIVGEADSGGALLDLLTHTSTDVILLDVRMPGMNGLDALAELSPRFPDVRVIVLSMHDEPAYVRRAIELGAHGYLLKRATREELLDALRAVAGGGAYIQGQLTGTVLDQVTRPGNTHELPHLSSRERETLQLVADGLGNHDIAERLGVSEGTIKSHLKMVFHRLEVNSRAEATAVGLRLGLID